MSKTHRRFCFWTVFSLAAAAVFVVGDRVPATPRLVDASPRPLGEAALLRDLELRATEVYDRVAPAVVGIRVRGSRGSGVIVSPDGLILTAAHVFSREGELATIYFSDGRTARAVSLGRNDADDAGMMEIVGKRKDWPHVELGRSGDLALGDWCLGLGHPGGFDRDRPPVLRIGRYLPEEGTLMRTDCAIVSGDSGGPLLDLDGRLIGIHSRIFRGLSRNYHVPIDRFRARWTSLRHGAPFLGVQAGDTGSGWSVERVVAGSAAKTAGLRRGDVILRVGDHPYRKGVGLAEVMARFKPADVLKVTFLRKGERDTAEVTLGRRKDFVE